MFGQVATDSLHDDLLQLSNSLDVILFGQPTLTDQGTIYQRVSSFSAVCRIPAVGQPQCSFQTKLLLTINSPTTPVTIHNAHPQHTILKWVATYLREWLRLLGKVINYINNTKKQVMAHPFDSISPIRQRQLSNTRSQLHNFQSTELIEIFQESKVETDNSHSVRSRRRYMHKQPLYKPMARRKQLPQILNSLYIKKTRFSFQLIKQFFLFSESQVSLNPSYRYIPQLAEDGLQALRSFITTQNQNCKIMAFQHIRFFTKNRFKVQKPVVPRSPLPQRTISRIVSSIELVMESVTNRLLNDFYQKVREYSEMQKSQILMPRQPRDNQTIRKNSKSSLSERYSSSNTHQSGQKQIIYIVKTSSSSKQKHSDHQLHRRKSAFIKVPLVCEDVVINQISVANITQLDHQRRHIKQKRSKKVSSNLCSDHICKQCAFCPMFQTANLPTNFTSRKQSSGRIISQTSSSKKYKGLGYN